MSRLQELFEGCVTGARMARDNARNDRRMAREWPADAAEYEADARKAFRRAHEYLRMARSFRDSIESRSYAHAAE